MSVFHPSLEATCDRCGKTEDIEGDSITSGHFMFPTLDEVGWGWSDEGDLCPDCVASGEAKAEADP